MTTLVRWLLLPFVAVAAWLAAFLTMYAFDLLYWKFDYPCPRRQITSGSCSGVAFDWYERYMEVLMCVGAGLAAIYVVVACTWIAPTHKARTALVVFAVGALVAIVLGWKEPFAMFSAIFAGGGTAALMQKRMLPLRPPNNSLERTREG